MEEKMTFEEALALLKAGKKVVRTQGWSGAENYVKLYDSIVLESGEKLEVTPYFLIIFNRNILFIYIARKYYTRYKFI